MAALLFAGVLPCFKTSAATTTAAVSATIISPTEVSIVTAAELLKSASTGVLTLSIPGGGATGTGDGAGMTLSSTGVVGNTIAFSTTDSDSLTSLIQALAASGGSIGMNGMLSTGQVVSLFVTHAEQGDNGKGIVYAVVAYN